MLGLSLNHVSKRGHGSQNTEASEALRFSLICAWINGWVNNHEAGDLRRHRARYAVIVMWLLPATSHAQPWSGTIKEHFQKWPRFSYQKFVPNYSLTEYVTLHWNDKGLRRRTVNRNSAIMLGIKTHCNGPIQPSLALLEFLCAPVFRYRALT